MRSKKGFIFLLLFTILSTTFFVVKASNDSLIVAVNHDGELLEEIAITDNNFNIRYDDMRETLTVSSKEEDFKKEISIPYNKKTSITFISSGDVLVELENNDDYYNGISMLSSEFVELIIEDSTCLVSLGDDVLYHDSEGFGIDVRWNFRTGDPKSDVFVNDIKNPLTIEEITKISGLFAYDKHDGDITSKISIKEDNYTPNINEIGNYKVIYEVVNISNKVSEYTLNVVNMYYGKPVISGDRNLTFEYSDEIIIDEILKDYTVSDEYDENIEFYVDDNTIVDGVVGDYQIILKAVSRTYQVGMLQVNIKIIDSTIPKFVDKHEGKMKFNFQTLPTNKELLIDLEAYDDYDGDITENIVVRINNLGATVGEYNVIYEVKDKAGNRAQYERIIQVTSDYEPEFFVSKNLLSIRDAYTLTIEQIAEIISDINDIEMVSYELINDTYTNSANVVGKYEVSMIITDNEEVDHLITQKINVFNLDEKESKTKVILIVSMLGISILIINGVIIKKLKK